MTCKYVMRNAQYEQDSRPQVCTPLYPDLGMLNLAVENSIKRTAIEKGGNKREDVPHNIVGGWRI